MKTIRAPTPAGVRLSRDGHGVPHVHAETLADAYWGMGYCHALDRGMQLCFMRILGSGRVAELLDGSDDGVAIDRFFRRMNWAGRMTEQLEQLTERATGLLQRYCDGVDARLQRKIPWELRVLGYRPEPWQPADSLMLSRMAGYLTLAQSQAEIERLYLEMLQAGIGDAKLSALFPDRPRCVAREILEQIRLGERIVPAELKWLGGAPRVMASNNWAVAASHSKTGHALLANDPHLEINRLPNVWVEQVVELPDDTVIMANMPGLPAPLIGRNRDLSWGATYSFMDGVDSWVEECRDGKYRRGDSWHDFEVREELIERKRGDAVTATFLENMHGVLEGDPHEAGYLLATRWAPSDSGARSLNATVAMWQARTVEQGMAILGRLETAWNWVLADSQGNIGYQMSGRLPVRHADANGFTPMPGWDPAFDWQGWVPPEELPRVVNPAEGFIVTANQDLNHLGQVRAINMPMGDYRARRIAEVLARGPCDRETFETLHRDVSSIQAEEMMAILEPALPDTPGAALLRSWDRCYDTESRGAALFEGFYRELLREMFAPAGLGDPVLVHLRDATGVFIDFYQDFDRVLTDEDSVWLDGRSLTEVYRAAFERAEQQYDQRAWGTSNRVVLGHLLLAGKLPRWCGFDRGPIALAGGRATPHQGQVYRSAGRTTSFAPSLRLIADMGEEVLHTAIVGGPSDRRFSRWYDSGVADWLAGAYKTLGRSGAS